MPEERYVLEVNEEQLRLINRALEEFFRIRLNQWTDLADDLASREIDLSSTNPNHDKLFTQFLTLRDCVYNTLTAVGSMIWRRTGYTGNEKQLDQKIAEDIWQVVRHRLWIEHHTEKDNWCVDSREPLFESGLPAPVCRRVDNISNP